MPSESGSRLPSSGLSSSSPESSENEAEFARSNQSASGESSSEKSSSSSSSSSSEEEDNIVMKRQKNAIRADLTPHHRLEKRPQRRTAAMASEAWSGLRPGLKNSTSTSSILDDVPFAVVIDNRSSNEQRRDASKRKIKVPNRASPETIVSTPVKEKRGVNGKGKERERQDEVLSTPKGKGKAKDTHMNRISSKEGFRKTRTDKDSSSFLTSIFSRQSSTPSRSSSKGRKSSTPATNGSANTSLSTSSPGTPTPAPRQRKKSTSSGSTATNSTRTKSLLSNSTTAADALASPIESAKKVVSRKSSSRGLRSKMNNPKTEHYEFGGPIGAIGVSTAVPFFSYALYYFCNEANGCSALPKYPDLILRHMWKGVIASFFDGKAWALYFGWYAFTVACWAILPGKVIKGGELRSGKKLDYKMNAFATLVLSFVLTAAFIAIKGPAAFATIYDHWPGLVTASLVNSFIQAAYVYVVSFKGDKLLATGGNSGNALFDWFIGRELNPRIGSFDIKTFNELRPGLILWALLDIACACHQYVQLRGRLTDSMMLVVAFQSWYVIDALYNESAILTQMDITTDGFGFMLSVGDLTWVPFTYGLQARYLAFMPKDLGLLGVIGVLAVNGIGYYIFRTANGEKNDFRNGKNTKNLKSMTTQSGRKLLTSGWWGLSRHPNYLGDWIMAWAWCLPTGFSTPVTYFYVVFFAVLLVHRQMRDDEACTVKYGKDWAKYCKLVPSRIIPYIY